jgi:hypothetical protein
VSHSPDVSAVFKRIKNQSSSDSPSRYSPCSHHAHGLMKRRILGVLSLSLSLSLSVFPLPHTHTQKLHRMFSANFMLHLLYSKQFDTSDLHELLLVYLTRYTQQIQPAGPFSQGETLCHKRLPYILLTNCSQGHKSRQMKSGRPTI